MRHIGDTLKQIKSRGLVLTATIVKKTKATLRQLPITTGNTLKLPCLGGETDIAPQRVQSHSSNVLVASENYSARW